MEFVKRGRWRYYLITCPKCQEDRYVRADVKQNKTCLSCHKKKHGLAINAKTKVNENNWLYRRWQRMKRRCKTTPSYIKRNIFVCEEWENDFYAFYKWATAEGAKRELELDRIDNNKGYSQENCRWVTHKENCRPNGRSGKFAKELK